MLERLLFVLALRDVAPGKPVWLVGLSFARDTRRFVEGAVQQVKRFRFGLARRTEKHAERGSGLPTA